MPTPSLKQESLDSRRHLPENGDIDEIMYRLFVIDKLRKSSEAIERGEVIDHEAMKRVIKQWLSSGQNRSAKTCT
jgi:hypothetical protein